MAPYRPPGRSNRSGRTQADNDVFEGLPVKQWSNASTRISLAPPVSETAGEQAQDRWGEPPMPRDYHLLQPWTQQLLRLARSGKVGQKRKSVREADDAEGEEYVARADDEGAHPEDANTSSKVNLLGDERAFVAKKWKPVPDHALVPEHLHWEFLAKRRKGLPSFYHLLNGDTVSVPVPTRKAKVQRVVDADTGESAVYEVIVPEGQAVEGEIAEGSELATAEPKPLPAGTVVDGLGVANEDGVLVAEVRNSGAVAQRRNRPPPKKKGGPGRGKKRVTFTNPDGSTYTTIVPNATKIVPQPGQTVKHVAKGEEAVKDVSAEEAAVIAKDIEPGEGDEEGGDDDDDDGDEDGDEDDDREDGELVDEDADTSAIDTPNPVAVATHDLPETSASDEPVTTGAIPGDPTTSAEIEDTIMPDAASAEPTVDPQAIPAREASSSPDVPLAQTSTTHSRQNSTTAAPVLPAEEHAPVPPSAPEASPTAIPEPAPQPTQSIPGLDLPDTETVSTQPVKESDITEPTAEEPQAAALADEVTVDVSQEKVEVPAETTENAEEDLLGSLERHLEANGK